MFLKWNIVPFSAQYTTEAKEIWNEVVAGGDAFPQDLPLSQEEALTFFTQQTFTGLALHPDTGEAVGLYILHPNNVGRCGHLCNASYAVASAARGQGVGEALVRHCMATAKERGFRVLQFNAVVAQNLPALHLYRKLGFVQLGVIPDGFLHRDGTYRDIIPHYRVL